MLARVVERLNAEAPDAILLLGDYIDAHPLWGGRVTPEQIARELSALRAPLGVFAVLGNHDWKQAGDRMWSALTAAGIEVLENRAVPAGDFHVAGLADLRLRRPDLPTTLATRPARRAGDPARARPRRVPLRARPRGAHRSPATSTAARWRSRSSGVPPSRRATASATRAGTSSEEDRHLYVSSGVGTSGLPLRFLAPPEVVVLELVSRAAGSAAPPSRCRPGP